jgi:phosphate transport system substrate-binding protein
MVIAAFALVGCSSPALPAATPTTNTVALRLQGTSATAPLLADLSLEYSQLYPNHVFLPGSGRYEVLVEQAQQGEIPYFISNHLPPDSALWAAPVGQDGIAVIVHPSNTLTNLTLPQLREIYQGQVTAWTALGGQDERIRVFSREQGSGTRAEFERLVMGERPPTKSALISPSNDAMLRSISSVPGSIGYISMGYLQPSVKPLMVEGISVNPQNVYNNSYPLRSTLFVVGLNEPLGEYRALIAWIQSPDGQAVVARRYAPLLQP